ncbi:MAG: phosphatidylglycerophosphatase A [Betaproteobacteria bacterium]|nr:phosphatidylglycerophosphatase A [Betaproteobacteria bacterium]
MIVRPSGQFLLSHPAHFLALGFGTGLAPVAPGTVGTLLGFPVYWMLAWWFGPGEILIAALAMFVVGIWACQRTGDDMGIADHSGMVWDEVVAFVVILVFTPPGLFWQAFAFFAFRFFDVLKPPPIREADRRWKGGFGVMFDDILAAGYTLLLIALAKRLIATEIFN